MTDDLISRQAAIDIADAVWCVTGDKNVAKVWDQIRDLPSADVPDKKIGKWIWLSSTYDRTPREMRFGCSECHHETITHGSMPWEKYCPNCGAKMEDADER